jgi:hypothetical protein
VAVLVIVVIPLVRVVDTTPVVIAREPMHQLRHIIAITIQPTPDVLVIPETQEGEEHTLAVGIIITLAKPVPELRII